MQELTANDLHCDGDVCVSDGKPGFATILKRIKDVWATKSGDLTKQADEICKQIQIKVMDVQESKSKDLIKLKDAFDACAKSLHANFDPNHGGFSGIPKFPRPVVYSLLLFHGSINSANTKSLQLATKSLRALTHGGIHDILCGGFHRYAVNQVSDGVFCGAGPFVIVAGDVGCRIGHSHALR